MQEPSEIPTNTTPSDNSYHTWFIRVIYGADPADIKIEYIFRGDAGTPDQIHQKGFTARGTNLDLLSHANPKGTMYSPDSGYVATSKSKRVAASFSKIYPAKPNTCLVYEINPQKNGVDVINALQSEITSGKIDPRVVSMLKHEQEIAVPFEIKPQDIKGVWVNKSGQPHETFIPNPNYKTPLNVSAVQAIQTAGKIMTGIAVALDGASLYQSYQRSEETGDYHHLFKEGARILSAWTGATVAGTTAAIGATAVCGPPCGLVAGFGGSGLGYQTLSSASEKVYDFFLNRSPDRPLLSDFSFVSSAEAAGAPELTSSIASKISMADITKPIEGFHDNTQYPADMKLDHLARDPSLQTFSVTLTPSIFDPAPKKIKNLEASQAIKLVDLINDPAVQTLSSLLETALIDSSQSNIDFSKQIKKTAFTALKSSPEPQKSLPFLADYIVRSYGPLLDDATYNALTSHYLEDNIAIDDISKDLKEILNTSKTFKSLVENVKDRITTLQEKGTAADQEILRSVSILMDDREQQIALDKARAPTQLLENTGQCAFALANLSQALGNPDLAKPLTIIGATCQGLSAAAMASTLSGTALLGPVGCMISSATMILSTLFSNNDGNELLGEYLQHITGQIHLLRDDVFELRKDVQRFKDDLYEKLDMSFGAVHYQLSYIAETLMCNIALKTDYHANRLEQGIEAILTQHDQDILAPALSYGKTIARDIEQDKVIGLLSRVKQLLDNSTATYNNGASFLSGTAVQNRPTIQQLLNAPYNRRGALFGYIAAHYPVLSNPSIPMINPYLWIKAAKAYLNLRDTPIAQKEYDNEYRELIEIQSQAEHYIAFMHKLRQEAPSIIDLLFKEMNDVLIKTANEVLSDSPWGGAHNPTYYFDRVREQVQSGGHGINCQTCQSAMIQHLASIPSALRPLLSFSAGPNGVGGHHLSLQADTRFSKYNQFSVLSTRHTPLHGSWSFSVDNNINAGTIALGEAELRAERQQRSQKVLAIATAKLPHYHERFIKASLHLNVLLNLIGLPHGMDDFPTSPFPQEISTWIANYRADVQQSNYYNPYPLSSERDNLLECTFKIASFKTSLMLDVTKSLQSPYSQELSEIYLILSRLYDLQATPSSARKLKALQAQLEQDQQSSRSAIEKSREELTSRLLGLRQLAERLRPLVQTRRLSDADLFSLIQAIEQAKNQLGLDVSEQVTSRPNPLPKQSFLKQRWEQETNALPFDETVVRLKQVAQHFKTFPKKINHAVVFVGHTGVGKSTLINRFLGVEYAKLVNDSETFAQAIHDDEFAKTNQSSVSETLFPYAFPLNEYHLIDMPGFEDSRGQPTEISNGIGMLWLKQYIANVKGLVIVCDNDDFSLKSKFSSLRRSLEAVGHMIQGNPDEIEQQLCLVVTRSSKSSVQILETLKNWEKSEYASVTKDSSDSQKAVKRVLSLLTRAPDSIFVVDVTEPNAHLPLLEKINGMRSHTIAPFSFVPATVDIKLLKQIIHSIREAKELLQADIFQRQSALLHTFKETLNQYHSSLPSTILLHEHIEKLKTYVAQSEVPGLELDTAHALIDTMSAQQDLVNDVDDITVYLSQMFNNQKITLRGYVGDESAVVEGLIQNHDELSLNRAFFELIEEINEIINPDVKISALPKSSFFISSPAPKLTDEKQAHALGSP